MKAHTQNQSTGHTAGPWRVAPASDYAGDGINVDSGPNGTAGYVCLCGQPGDAVAEANARLIAASPDLLAALEETTEALKEARRFMPLDAAGFILYEETGAVQSQARAAIARAKGQ